MEIAYLADYPQFSDEVARRNYAEWGRLCAAAGLSLEELKIEMRRRCTKQSIPFALVAVSDGALVGSVSVKLDEPTSVPGLSPWLGGLLVSENLRGRGIGSALLLRAEAVVGTLGIATIYLSCEQRLKPFYVSNGWQLRRNVVSLGDLVSVMQKAIA